VSWSWSLTTDQCGEMARLNVCPPPFIVISVHRHACQLIKLCSENATFYRRQSVVYRQWHPVRIAGRIAADPIMAAAYSCHDSSWCRILRFCHPQPSICHRRRRTSDRQRSSTIPQPPPSVCTMYTSSVMLISKPCSAEHIVNLCATHS